MKGDSVVINTRIMAIYYTNQNKMQRVYRQSVKNDKKSQLTTHDVISYSKSMYLTIL